MNAFTAIIIPMAFIIKIHLIIEIIIGIILHRIIEIIITRAIEIIQEMILKITIIDIQILNIIMMRDLIIGKDSTMITII